MYNIHQSSVAPRDKGNARLQLFRFLLILCNLHFESSKSYYIFELFLQTRLTCLKIQKLLYSSHVTVPITVFFIQFKLYNQ